MTYLDAAYQILSAAEKPLHYQEIARLALEQNLITPAGLTPEATMGSRLYTDTKHEGSSFVRAGRGVFDLTKRRPAGIDARVREINATTRAQLNDLLHAMPPDRFEALVYELLIQMGFAEDTLIMTPYRGDGGIDVTGVLHAAGLTDVNAGVQVKRWKKNVSAPTVTQLRGSLEVHQQGIIVTTSDFTAGAKREATAPGKSRISLINGEVLLDLLFKYKVGVQEKTLTVMSVDEDWWGDLLLPAGAIEIPAAPAVAPQAVEVPATPATVPDVTALLNLPNATEGPTGRKPQGFVLFGRPFEATSWKSVLVQVASTLAQRHPDDFCEKALALRGRTRRYVSLDNDSMTAPANIPGTDLWIETNLSAADILIHVHDMLGLFGYSADSFQVSYANSRSNQSQRKSSP